MKRVVLDYCLGLPECDTKCNCTPENTWWHDWCWIWWDLSLEYYRKLTAVKGPYYYPFTT